MKRVPFVLFALVASSCAAFAEEAVKFSRDVLPILSENCLSCHGPDESHRKGELRLDVREAAIQKKALLPGDPEESEMIKRIVSSDNEEVMPPPRSHKPKLSEAQVEILKRWIREGAVWANIGPLNSP
jgi:mono/diheme cytochrome c family protein